MADTTTGLAVKSLAAETVRSKLVDTAGTNEAAISAAGRVSVDGSGVTQPVSIAATVTVDTELTAVAALADATANPTITNIAGFLMGYNGSTWDRVRTANTGRLQVDVITGGGSNASVLVDNAAFTDGTSSVTAIGYIFDDVAGTALTENDVAAARIDSKRATVFVGEDATTRAQKWAISSAGALSSNITQVGGATHSATVPLFARLTDGTAVYSKTGQTAGTAAFAQLSDQTTAVNVISGTNALKTDLSSVAGTATVTGGISGVQAIAGPTAADAAIAAQPITVGARGSTALPTAMSADGDVVNLWASLNGALNVTLRDTSGTYVAPSGTQYVGDAAATSTPTGTIAMGLANAAAPADVSANNDAVAQWFLRNGSAVVNLASGGTLVTLGSKVSASSIPVVIASDQGSFAVTVSGVATAANQTNVQIVDNAAFTDGTTTLLMGGYIFDDVAGTALTENDAAAARIDTKRAQMFVGEDATTRGQKWAISSAGALASNITQIGGATPGATVFLPTRITDGAAYYTKTGQTAGTASFTQLSDQTNTASIIAAINSLKVDISSIVGAVPSATNPLPVRVTDGTSYYTAASSAPTSPQFSTKTSSALGAGASIDLTHYVTSGKTGHLMGVDVASTVPLKCVINTEVTAAKTTRVVLFTLAAIPISWRTPYKTFITRASADSTSGFSVTLTNKDASVAADVYSTAFWDEV